MLVLNLPCRTNLKNQNPRKNPRTRSVMTSVPKPCLETVPTMILVPTLKFLSTSRQTTTFGSMTKGIGLCEVIVGSAPKCLPTSVPVLPILLRAILYTLQYLYSFPPIVRLFYLTRCMHPYLFLVSIQPGMIQFPPEMDENWLRYELSSLRTNFRTKLAEDVVLCVHNTTSALNR